MTEPHGSAHARKGKAHVLAGFMFGVLLMALAMSCASRAAHADTTLNPSLLPAIESATFEVVAAKPKDPLTYEKPLPMDLVPYQERTDKYYSIGTAFAIGPNRYVTAGHVLMTGYNSLWGPPALRDASGKVYAIDKIEKFALRRDFVVFSLKDPPRIKPLPLDTEPALNQVVYSVGNALGTGVVIRNGLYTSDTPEAQDGQWKWIRFSAAASPGNSGGPLLDQNGKVIGVVLMKSPNENLNYALPISQVLNAPKNLARYDRRLSYQFDAFDATLTGTFKGSFPLPMNLADFFASYARAFEPYLDSQLKTLLQQQSAQLFPNGDGAHQLLYSSQALGDFPQLLARNPDGVWGTLGKRAIRITLPANGYIAGGVAHHDILFHLRKPDTIPERQFHHDPKGVMDLLLKTGVLKRKIGPDQIRVTSLGNPSRTSRWTDHWGRHWQVWTWPVPYANGYQVMFALPTPDGYAILTRLGPAREEHDIDINLRALTDFIRLPYDGTLAQWKAFLAEPKLLPDAFGNIHIGFAYGKDFHYASRRMAFSITSALQNIDPDSMLTLDFGFIPGHDQVAWGVKQVWLAPNDDNRHMVGVSRHQAPPPDLDDHFQRHWKKVVDKRNPYDAMAFSGDNFTGISAVVVPSGPDKPSVLYTASVYQPGTQPQAAMKKKLDLLLKGVKIRER